MKIKDEYRPADKKEGSFGVTEELEIKSKRESTKCNFERFADEMRRRQDSNNRQRFNNDIQQFWK